MVQLTINSCCSQLAAFPWLWKRCEILWPNLKHASYTETPDSCVRSCLESRATTLDTFCNRQSTLTSNNELSLHGAHPTLPWLLFRFSISRQAKQRSLHGSQTSSNKYVAQCLKEALHHNDLSALHET